jgi:predicted nucleotidyltransferase
MMIDVVVRGEVRQATEEIVRIPPLADDRRVRLRARRQNVCYPARNGFPQPVPSRPWGSRVIFPSLWKDALVTLTAEQSTLVRSIQQVLERDEAIEAAWIAGSLGAGKGDEYSDVDIVALVAAGRGSEIGSYYARHAERIAEPILVKTLFDGRILNIITSQWQRFDISFLEVNDLTRFDPAGLENLFNKTRVVISPRERAHYVSSTATILKLVNEFLRMMGLLVVAVGREEWVNGQTGVDIVRRLTVDLLLERNGIEPAERGGALHLNVLLTPEQRVRLENLDAIGPNKIDIVRANMQLAAIFLPLAREMVAEAGAPWPRVFEAATAAHLRSNLGLTLP